MLSAKEYRKNSTKSEEIMWRVLRNRQLINLKFRRQYILAGYIIDFYCASHKIAIEVDGSIHDNKAQIEHDKYRQDILESHGIKFIRVRSERVEQNLAEVLKELKLELNRYL